tara:strand:- start:647 stop:1813 length:1167 start_codon:yes stop_codon:yes gene_type:complete
MSLEGIVDNFEYNVGDAIHSVLHDTLNWRSYLKIPKAPAIAIRDSTIKAGKGIANTYRNVKTKLKDNFKDSSLKGIAKTVGSSLYQTGRGIVKTGKKTLNNATSLPAVGALAGGFAVLGAYVHSMRSTFPLHLSGNSIINGAKLIYKIPANIGYNVLNGTFNGLRSAWQGIRHTSLDSLKEAGEHFGSVSNIPNTLLKNLSFGPWRETLESVFHAVPYVGAGMLALTAGKYLINKRRGKIRDKDSTNFLNKGGKAAIIGGEIAALGGLLAYFYQTTLSPYQGKAKLIGTAGNIAGGFFGVLPGILKGLKTLFDYTIDDGLPDAVSFLGRPYGKALHVIDNIPVAIASNLMIGGAAVALVGSVMYMTSCYKKFKENQPNQDIHIQPQLT